MLLLNNDSKLRLLAIIIALESLHKNFNIITTSLLKIGNKTIHQIQSILLSKKAKNLNKQIIKSVGNQAMTF